MSEKEFEVNSDLSDTPGTLSSNIIGIQEFKEAEWVFQFDDDEPVVFAWTNGEGEEPAEVNIKLKANSQSSIFFASPDLEKRLRIFCREMTEETKKGLKNT